MFSEIQKGYVSQISLEAHRKHANHVWTETQNPRVMRTFFNMETSNILWEPYIKWKTKSNMWANFYMKVN